MMKYQKKRGLSLLELGLCIVVMSAALVPIIQMLGAKGESSNYSSTNDATRGLSRYTTAGNSIMEMALANNPDAAATPVDPGTFAVTPAQRKVFGDYGKALYYDWQLSGLAGAAKQNKLYAATLRVYSNPNDTKPAAQLSTVLASLATSYPDFTPPPAPPTNSPTCQATAACSGGICTVTSVTSGCTFGCTTIETTTNTPYNNLTFPGGCSNSLTNTATQTTSLKSTFLTIKPPTGTSAGQQPYEVTKEVAFFKYHDSRYGLELP